MTVRAFNAFLLFTKQVVVGSLTWLPFDGSGVLYDPGFTLEKGFTGKTWTIAGASMKVNPEAINLKSHGRFVTIRIEAENNRAAEIDVATLTLSVDGVNGDIPPASVPCLVNFDGDLNIDLEAKFDRAALASLLAIAPESTAIVRANWSYADGTPGTASAQVNVTETP